ncbi:MAG: protein translocase subunit SecD [Patescibacteria group bacterium]
MSDNILQKILRPTPKGRLWQVFVFIIVLTIVGGLIDAGNYYNKGTKWLAWKTGDIVVLPQAKEIPFRLGLDLVGGTHLVYTADVSAIPSADRNDAAEGARDVIERRVNVFGVAEPIVQVNKTAMGDYRIIVELAGIKNVEEAIKMIGETPLLEFKEKATEGSQLTAEQQKKMDDFNKAAETKAEEVLGKAISGGDFAALAREYSEDEKTKSNGGDLGWITESQNPEVIALAKSLKAGQVTQDLAKGSQGYEIIKLEDKRIKKDPFGNSDEMEIKASHLLICFTGSQGCENGLAKEEAYAKIKDLKNQATPANFSQLVKDNSTEPGAAQSGGDLGWFSRGMMVKPFEDAVFSQKIGTISDIIETDFGYHLIYKQEERKLEEYKVSHILITTMSVEDIVGTDKEWKNTELTGKYLKRASVEFNPNDNSPEVALEFDSEGANLFETITARNVGQPVAIFLDGYAISVPTVNEKITGGKAVISGKFNIQEAKLLAQRLNAGALPVPITLVSQQTIGPSLGQASVAASLKAGIISFLLVALFMILFYRLPGLMAVFALAVYSVLVLAVFKLWPVTLSLAGIAGFIVSIGMAVDANILIFARMKEEIKNGKSLAISVSEGFRRAWPSIRDSNFNTLITCFILIQFTTSVIKGFAITLALGVIISMFTAIFITRNFLSLIPGAWLEKKSWLITSHKNLADKESK